MHCQYFAAYLYRQEKREKVSRFLKDIALFTSIACKLVKAGEEEQAPPLPIDGLEIRIHRFCKPKYRVVEEGDLLANNSSSSAFTNFYRGDYVVNVRLDNTTCICYNVSW